MSFKKYHKGQLSNLIVLSKYLKQHSFTYLKKKVVVYMKIIIAFLLFTCKGSRFLISLRGKSPNTIELNNFMNHQQNLSKSL
jgi:hypothetical protein